MFVFHHQRGWAHTLNALTHIDAEHCRERTMRMVLHLLEHISVSSVLFSRVVGILMANERRPRHCLLIDDGEWWRFRWQFMPSGISRAPNKPISNALIMQKDPNRQMTMNNYGAQKIHEEASETRPKITVNQIKHSCVVMDTTFSFDRTPLLGDWPFNYVSQYFFLNFLWIDYYVLAFSLLVNVPHLPSNHFYFALIETEVCCVFVCFLSLLLIIIDTIECYRHWPIRTNVPRNGEKNVNRFVSPVGFIHSAIFSISIHCFAWLMTSTQSPATTFIPFSVIEAQCDIGMENLFVGNISFA